MEVSEIQRARKGLVSRFARECNSKWRPLNASPDASILPVKLSSVSLDSWL